jgi:hypothetical protein
VEVHIFLGELNNMVLLKVVLRFIWTVFPFLLAWLLLGCTPTAPVVITPIPVSEGPDLTEEPVQSTPTLQQSLTVEPTLVPTNPPLPQPSPSPTAERPLPTQIAQPAAPLPINQTIQFTIENQFGGIPHAIQVVENRAYVGFGPRLFILDVTDPENIELLGKSDALPDAVKGIAIKDNLAVVGAGSSGLHIFDISQPASIVHLNQQTSPLTDAGNVTLVGNHAFVHQLSKNGETSALLRFDLATPTQPIFAESMAVETGHQAMVVNDLLIVVGNGRFRLTNALDFNQLFTEVTLTSGAYMSHFYVQFPYLFVSQAGQQNGLEVFDISNPAQVTAVTDFINATFFILDESTGSEQTMFIAGTFGEFGHCSTQIAIIDISTPTAPQHISEFDPENCATDISWAADRLYVTGRSGLKIFDVTQPGSPTLLNHFAHPDGFQDAQGIVKQNNFVHLLTIEGRESDIRTMDVGQEDVWAETAVTFDTTTILNLHLTGDKLLAPLWNAGVNVIDATRPNGLQIVHPASEIGKIMSDNFAFALSDDVAYMPYLSQNIVGGIAAVDLNNQDGLAETAVFQTNAHGIGGTTTSGNHLFAMSQGETATLHVIDISNRLTPQQATSLDLPHAVINIAIYENTLFAFCGYYCNLITLIDISNPTAPTHITSYTTSINVWDAIVDDSNQLIYLLTYDDGFWALDVSNPSMPTLDTHYPLTRGLTRIWPENDTLWIAADSLGILQVEVNR